MAVILVRKPPQKPSYRRRVLLLPEAVSSDVTVAITGNSSTVSVGSLTPSVNVSVSGNSTTLSPGTLAPAISVPITGVSSSASVGSLVPSLSVALTGNSSVAGVGNLGLDISVPITGNVSTLSVGSVTPSIGGDVTVAITGVSSTFSVGSLVPSLSVPITGNVTTLAVGSVTASVPIAEQPSGGWESYLAHRKRQDQRVYEEEKRQEQIEAQRLAVEDAQLNLELEQERKAEEEQRDNRRNRVISQIARGIKAQQSDIEQMMAHLEALMVLDALERDQALQALIQKRRNAAIVLLLYAA